MKDNAVRLLELHKKAQDATDNQEAISLMVKFELLLREYYRKYY